MEMLLGKSNGIWHCTKKRLYIDVLRVCGWGSGRVILTHAPLYTLTNHEREEEGGRKRGEIIGLIRARLAPIVVLGELWDDRGASKLFILNLKSSKIYMDSHLLAP